MKVQWRQDQTAEEEEGAAGPPMASYPRELDGCPPTVPGSTRGGASHSILPKLLF